MQPAVTSVSAMQMGPGQMTGDHHGEPDHHMGHDGTVWVSTEVITIMANAEHPMFDFWFTRDTNGSMSRFLVNYNMLIEFEDLNEDDAFQSNEILYFAPLSAYEWTLQTGSVEDSEGVTTEVWLKYTKGGAVDGMGPGMPGMPGMGHMTGLPDQFEDVTMQIWAHIYLEDYEGTVTDDQGVRANFTVAGGSELKMDIEIGNFPFSNDNTSVAVQTILKENEALGGPAQHHHMFQTRERIRNSTFTSNDNWTTTGGNETMFHRMNNTCIQQIDFVNDNTGIADGFFSWVDQAVITWPGGDQEAVNVTASYAPTGMGLAALYLAYPNFDGGTILHDPSIGLDESQAPAVTSAVDPLLLAGIGVVALIAIIIVVIRKR
ncbi:MAG: hypothetical protein ACXABL_11905 [Candidatus Thorarchaeota archaeon]